MAGEWAGAGIALTAMVLIAGCGGAESPEQSEAPPTEPTAQSTHAEEGSSPPSPAEQPVQSPCPEESSVTVDSTNGGYPGGIDWSNVYAVAERPYAGLGGDGRAVVVYLSTTDRPLTELNDRKIELAPAEGFLELTFTNGEQDAGTGDYATSVDTTAPDRLNLDVHVHVTGRTTVNVDSSTATGQAQLTDSGDAVCGAFEIADKHTSASGVFVAAVEG